MASTSSILGIHRKVAGFYFDVEVVTRSFWSFVPPLLEFCSAGAVTCGLAQLHVGSLFIYLSVLDRVVA